MTFKVVFTPSDAHRKKTDVDQHDGDCRMIDDDGDDDDDGDIVHIGHVKAQRHSDDDNNLARFESWVPFGTQVVFGTDGAGNRNRQFQQEQQQHAYFHQNDKLVDQSQHVLFHPAVNPPKVDVFDFKVDFRPATTKGSKRKADDDVDIEESRRYDGDSGGAHDVSMLDDEDEDIERGNMKDLSAISSNFFRADFSPNFLAASATPQSPFPCPTTSPPAATQNIAVSSLAPLMTQNVKAKPSFFSSFRQWSRGRSIRGEGGVNADLDDYVHRPTKRSRITESSSIKKSNNKSKDDCNDGQLGIYRKDEEDCCPSQKHARNKRKGRADDSTFTIMDTDNDRSTCHSQRQRRRPTSILKSKSSIAGSIASSNGNISICGSLDLDLNATLDSRSSRIVSTTCSNVSTSSVYSESVMRGSSIDSSRKKIRIVDSKMFIVQRLVSGSLLAFGGGRRDRGNNNRGQGRRQHQRRQRRNRRQTNTTDIHPQEGYQLVSDDSSSKCSHRELIDETVEQSMRSSIGGDDPSSTARGILFRTPSSILSSGSSTIESVASWNVNNEGDCFNTTDFEIDGDDGDDERNSWMLPPSTLRIDCAIQQESSQHDTFSAEGAFGLFNLFSSQVAEAGRKPDPPGTFGF